VKQGKSALFFCLTVLVLAAAFGFGRYVSISATAPLRQANAVASQQAKRDGWTVEALGGTSLHSVSLPSSSSPATQIASNNSGSSDDPSNDELYGANSPLVTFQQVYELLKGQYVNKIPSDTPLAHGAVSALIASLDDPNSRFVSATERSSIDDENKGIFAGTGIVFTVRKEVVNGLLERQLTVVDAVAGSPADKVGIQTGDVITDINNQWIVTYDPFQAQVKLFKSLVKDPVGYNHAVDSTEAKIKDGLTLPAAQALLDTSQTTPLDLTIDRGGKTLKLTVDASSSTTVPDVASKLLPDGNGYVQFNAFTESTAADFAKAFSTVGSAHGIVIDLRNCPGGSIDPAIVIGQELAPDQLIGSLVVRDSHGTLDKPIGIKVKSEPLAYVADASQPANPINYAGHIVVLVNNGTANTAELLAAFLHDHLGARIVGASTFGDGMAQTLFPMPDGSGFTLTTGLVKTGDNVIFAGKGISLDEHLAQSDISGDVGIQRAEQALAMKPFNTSTTASSQTGLKS
jgi:carboxyl-terminal processing protease